MRKNKMDITGFDEVVPTEGTLTARIFENSHLGIEPTLVFDIDIPLEPFQFQGQQVSTSVRLDFIRLPVVDDWREIAGQVYEFPINPVEGYIDGSGYLDNVHNTADVTRLTFGPIESGRISCSLKVTFDFTYEGPEELGVLGLEWDIHLTFDEQKLDRVGGERPEADKPHA